MKKDKSLNISSIIKLLELNNPFFILTNKRMEIVHFSDSAYKIFKQKLKKGKHLNNYFDKLEQTDLNKKIFFLNSVCKNQKFKFNSTIIECYIVFAFSPVINHLKPN